MEGIVVPGSKSTKYKKERDLIGLSGDQVYCISEIFFMFLGLSEDFATFDTLQLAILTRKTYS